jgi:hypothetical protein
VRASAQSGTRTITDPAACQEFFASLSKGSAREIDGPAYASLRYLMRVGRASVPFRRCQSAS